ncbi:uncharacterized protein EDB91DRAFT_1248823 [Suillus paluster]|uniref:uncharacterized protein n=1 Tax=Suillus paluster TaxID=48578 RepID=UPI001B87E04D|nr:uncharacterized protein EDB91DRAFT_1248823 [Suillus paluster]KAG1739471.1 hypothetical protein EDB91DRAFT_1248823 [Suillus paluster]
MPALRQRARHSAWLRANANAQGLYSRAMNPPASSSQGQSDSNSQGVPKLTIQWERDHALITILINHLTTHPPDCHILFYSDGKKAMPSVDDAPSGKDKNEIHGFIAKLIFATHTKYKATYHQDPKKFCMSVTNHITSLRNKYRKCKDEVTAKLPWYTDLDSIWHSIPSFATKSHSSRPGVDHAGDLYALVQPHGSPGRAGPSTNFDGATQAGAPPQLPPYAQPSHSTFSPQLQPPHQPSHSAFTLQPERPNFTQPPNLILPPNAVPGGGDTHNLNDPLIDLHLLHAAPPPPDNNINNDADMDHYMHDPDDDTDNLYLSGPLSTPLGDVLRHLEDDSMTLDSPARAAGNKRQRASPSPPPDPPNPLAEPCSIWSTVTLQSWGVAQKNTIYRVISPTPQTSLPTSVGGSKKKKAKLDIQERVDKVTDEIKSIQSDAVSHHDSKHQRFLANLTQSPTIIVMQGNTSGFVTHESKDAEIHLHETDIRVHEAHSLVLDKEAENLRLKIQFHHLMQGSKPPASDGD